MEDIPLETDDRREIAKSLIEAMKNHPPKKEDMLKIFENVKSAFSRICRFQGHYR